jgi:hypothetical protein
MNIEIKHLKAPFVQTPLQVELTIFLIREELKSRKFFNSLQELGLDDSYYQPHLDELIMANVELNDESNETFDFYYNIMEKYSKKIEPDKNSITEQALNAYMELVNDQKRRAPFIDSNETGILNI